jgi:hypothetical protein
MLHERLNSKRSAKRDPARLGDAADDLPESI